MRGVQFFARSHSFSHHLDLDLLLCRYTAQHREGVLSTQPIALTQHADRLRGHRTSRHRRVEVSKERSGLGVGRVQASGYRLDVLRLLTGTLHEPQDTP